MQTEAESSIRAAGENAELFKALADPLRYRIIVILTERKASATQLAKILGASQGATAYHMRELKKVGLIEEVDSSTRRGGTEHFYRATARPIIYLENWEKLPKLIREVNSAWGYQLIAGEIYEAINAMADSIREGLFDGRPGRAMIRTPMVLDEKGWDELEPAANRFIEEMFDIQAKSAERMTESKEEGFTVSAYALAFETRRGRRQVD